jgi:hypothetical protein
VLVWSEAWKAEGEKGKTQLFHQAYTRISLGAEAINLAAAG